MYFGRGQGLRPSHPGAPPEVPPSLETAITCGGYPPGEGRRAAGSPSLRGNRYYMWGLSSRGGGGASHPGVPAGSSHSFPTAAMKKAEVGPSPQVARQDLIILMTIFFNMAGGEPARGGPPGRLRSSIRNDHLKESTRRVVSLHGRHLW